MPLGKTPSLDATRTARSSMNATPKNKLPSLEHESIKRPRTDSARSEEVPVDGMVTEELSVTAPAGHDIAMPDPDDPSPEMWPGVVTGDDAVAYYGQHGTQARVKFFYANRCAARGRPLPQPACTAPNNGHGAKAVQYLFYHETCR